MHSELKVEQKSSYRCAPSSINLSTLFQLNWKPKNPLRSQLHTRSFICLNINWCLPPRMNRSSHRFQYIFHLLPTILLWFSYIRQHNFRSFQLLLALQHIPPNRIKFTLIHIIFLIKLIYVISPLHFPWIFNKLSEVSPHISVFHVFNLN